MENGKRKVYRINKVDFERKHVARNSTDKKLSIRIVPGHKSYPSIQEKKFVHRLPLSGPIENCHDTSMTKIFHRLPDFHVRFDSRRIPTLNGVQFFEFLDLFPKFLSYISRVPGSIFVFELVENF